MLFNHVYKIFLELLIDKLLLDNNYSVWAQLRILMCYTLICFIIIGIYHFLELSRSFLNTLLF